MNLRETLAQALTEKFPTGRLHVGAPPDPLAEFQAAHPDVGDLTIRADEWSYSVTILIGQIFGTHFSNYDTHLNAEERAAKLTKEVIWFLEQLFADRLLFWRAADGRGSAWRERGDEGPLDPLVVDNRVYHPYLWSRPLVPWQAIPVIFGRGRVQTDREYEILVGYLRNPFTEDVNAAQREFAARLIGEYKPKN